MTVWRISAVWIALVGLVCATPARADFLEDFVHNVIRDTKRNNCWPNPFVYPDRQAARVPFVLMVNNGWRRQNMLGDYHFEQSSGELSESGRLKIRWILTEAPRHHRTIYVHRARSPEETVARMDAVQQHAFTLLGPQGEPPTVVESTVSPAGWPAERVDSIGRKFQTSAPDPRLPSQASSSEESN